MELTPKAQIVEQIRASQTILLLTHKDPDGDAVGGVLALRSVLQKLGKETEAAFFGDVPNTFNFLKGLDQVKSELTTSNELVLTIDTRQTGENLKLGHKKLAEEHQVMIVVTPEKGSLMPEDVTVTRSRPKYDLVIMLDCSAIERVGKLYEESPDLFFETPTINIDHHVTNTHFAKVNWVDMTATSTCEMLVSLIEALARGESLLDEEVATALLTGITTDTGSFQNAATTPKSLTVAAQLVAAGARQQEIIERVFRTRPLSTLKLWGKALSKLQEEENSSFAWVALDKQDFASVGSTAGEREGLIDGLLKTIAGVNFVVLLTEKEDGTLGGSMRSVNLRFNVSEIAVALGGGGHAVAAGFDVNEPNFAETSQKVLAKIRELAVKK